MEQENKAVLVRDESGVITGLQVCGQFFEMHDRIYVPKVYWDQIELSLLPNDKYLIVTEETEPSGSPLRIFYGVERNDDGSARVHFECQVAIGEWSEPLSIRKYMDLVFKAIDSHKAVTDRSLKYDGPIVLLWFNAEMPATHLGEVRDAAEKIIADVVRKANEQTSALRRKE